MTKGDYQLRVRPIRAAVLLPWEATKEESVLAIDFLSRLWGGRYCPIIPIKAEGDNNLAKGWLAQSRPDIVCGIGINHKEWAKICQECCQPYTYLDLNRKELDEVFRSAPVGLLPSIYVLRKIVNDNPRTEDSNIIFFHIAEENQFSLPIAASFGISDKEVSEWLSRRMGGEIKIVSAEIALVDYIELCKSSKDKWSILDLSGYGLSKHIIRGDLITPKTVVVGETNGAHLALFWNLRMQTETGSCGEILLFPHYWIEDQSVIEALSEWIAASPMTANFCQIISLSKDAESLRRLADKVRPHVRIFCVEYVDIGYGDFQIPIINAYEREAGVPVDIDDRIIKFSPPTPNFGEVLGQNREWLIDLHKDYKTGRAPMELFPMTNILTRDVLNTPFPPILRIHTVDRIKIGLDSISMRCSKKEPVLQYFMPADSECLEEILRSIGLEITYDEKRTCYEAVIRFFKDLEEAGRAFLGFPLRILDALNENILTLDELKGRAKLGKAIASEEPRMPVLDWLALDSIRKRIARQRIAEYRRKEHPSEDQALDVLDYWIKIGIVKQCFRLPQCPTCGHRYSIDKIDLEKSIDCPGCGTRISRTSTLDLAYKLNPLFCKALKEGIAPVILAGRFLQHLTNRSFMWVPGVKGIYKGEKIDIDIISLCDGQLILAECKSMMDVSEESKNWIKVQEQFGRLIAFGKECGAKIVKLASMADIYPVDLKEIAKQNSGDIIRVELLDRKDLEQGHRFEKKKIADERYQEVPMNLEDFLPVKTEQYLKWEREKGVRRMGF